MLTKLLVERYPEGQEGKPELRTDGFEKATGVEGAVAAEDLDEHLLAVGEVNR